MIVTTALSIVNSNEFSSQVADHARQSSSQMVVIPWSNNHSAEDSEKRPVSEGTSGTSTPFEGLFATQGEKTPVEGQAPFIRRVFAESPADVALYIDSGFTDFPDDQGRSHVFLPFFGGPDDRLALSFVVQLCMNPVISATVIRMRKAASDELTPSNTIEDLKVEQVHSTISTTNPAFPDTIYGIGDTQTRMASDTADDLLWAHYTTPASVEISEALSRIVFSEQSSPRPLHAILDAAALAGQSSARLLVVMGRSRRLAVESHEAELRALFSERGASLAADVCKTLGDVATAFVAASTSGSLLVLQARSG